MSKKEEAAKDYTYFHERLDPLGWTEERGRFTTPNWEFKSGTMQPVPKDQHDYRETTHELFDVDQNGDLVIRYFRITGAPTTFKRGDGPARTYEVVRFRNPPIGKDGKPTKYKSPAGGGTFPWFPPQLIEAYRNGTQIEALTLTEGPLKAYCTTNAGAYVVGLTGITQAKDSDKSLDQLHVDVVDLIRRCQPKKVIWLVDGDCRTIPAKWPEEDIDLWKRPNDFFRSIKTMRDLLQDLSNELGFSIWFKHVESLSVEVPDRGTPPKGVDDLVLALASQRVREAEARASIDVQGWADLDAKGQEKALKKLRIQAQEDAKAEVVKDLHASSGPSTFFYRKSLDRLGEIKKYFAINSAQEFHSEYNERIANRPFIFNGTQYQWDGKELTVLLPAVMRNYVRVGDTYYERVPVPNRFGQVEEKFHVRQRTTILEDHGKDKLKHVMKLKAFCNVPNHEDYQQIIKNCLNRYQPFEHKPEAGDFPHIEKFMKHIFGTGTVNAPHPKQKGPDGKPEMMEVNELDLGYDYMQLLFQKPTQILPILCLVSRERQTGKSTFAKLLKSIYTGNAAFVSSADLQSDFNEHWITKLAVICEEAFIEKKATIERIKDLSTASVSMMNSKGVAQTEIETFLKFILCSNNVRNFINTDNDEIRFWVRNVPPIPDAELDPDLENLMYEEIPSFLYFLSKRSMATQRLSRMWFHHKLLETDALRMVREHSVPAVRRGIESYIRGMFFATRQEEILMTASDVKAEVFRGNGYEEDYIRRTLKEDMGVDTWRNKKGEKATRTYSYYRIVERKSESLGINGFTQDLQEVKVNVPKRPFVFERSRFIDNATWELVKPNTDEMPAAGSVVVAGNEPLPDDLPF